MVSDPGPHPVRTILIRTWVPRRRAYHYTYLVTSLPWAESSEVDICHFYNHDLRGHEPGRTFRLRPGGRFSIVFTHHLHYVQMVCEHDKKSTMRPPANRPSGLVPGRNQHHRVSPDNERGTVEKLIERCKNVRQIIHRPTHGFWGLRCYFELRFLAYNLVCWYQHYVLQETDLDVAPNVFHLVRTVASQPVVAEQQPDGPLVRYLATAPAAIQHLIATTHAWLRRLDDSTLDQLALRRCIRFSWTCLVDAVWQASRRPGDLYQPLLCKT